MIAALIAAIAAVVVAGVSYAGNRSASKSAQQAAQVNTDKTIAANKEMAQFSYSKDLEMWNRGNEYNSPEAQQLRLSKAGLNPNLVYGSGTVTGNTTGQLPRYNAPTADYQYKPDTSALALGPSLAQGLGTFQDIRMQQNQSDLMKAQQKNVESKTVNEVITSSLLGSKLKMSPDVQELLKKQVERVKFDLDTSYGLRAYQFSVKEQEARQAEQKTGKAIQEVKLLKGQGALQHEELIFKQNQNRLRELGVMDSDSPWFRMIIQMANQAGISVKDWLNSIGK